MKRYFDSVARFGLCAFFSLGCSDSTDPQQTQVAGLAPGETACSALGTRCHNLPTPTTETFRCHDIGHLGDETACLQELNACLPLCDTARAAAGASGAGGSGGTPAAVAGQAGTAAAGQAGAGMASGGQAFGGQASAGAATGGATSGGAGGSAGASDAGSGGMSAGGAGGASGAEECVTLATNCGFLETNDPAAMDCIRVANAADGAACSAKLTECAAACGPGLCTMISDACHGDGAEQVRCHDLGHGADANTCFENAAGCMAACE